MRTSRTNAVHNTSGFARCNKHQYLDQALCKAVTPESPIQRTHNGACSTGICPPPRGLSRVMHPEGVDGGKARRVPAAAVMPDG